MANFTDNSMSREAGSVRFGKGEFSLWWAFGSGLIVALGAMYLVVARPMAGELELVRGQLARLEKSVQLVAGKHGSVQRTNGLLSRLEEQGRRSIAAGEALEAISGLQERLSRQTEQVEQALVAVDNLSLLKDRLLRQAPQLEEASAALATLGDLSERLTQEQDRAARAREALSSLAGVSQEAIILEREAGPAKNSLRQISSFHRRLTAQLESTLAASQALESLVALKCVVEQNSAGLSEAMENLRGLVELKGRTLADGQGFERVLAIVNQWSQLHNRLAESAMQVSDARHTGDELLGLQHDLIERAGRQSEARTALEGLISMRERLDGQVADLDSAQQTAAGLIELKDKVLAQTSNLADAIETLELTSDLQDQLEKAVRSFDSMRHSVIEILAFEPTAKRAMTILEPLTALGNLRRLSGGELRQAARMISEQRQSTVERHTADSQSNTTPALPVAVGIGGAK